MTGNIEVEVRLYAALRQYHPQVGVGEALVVSLPAGTTLNDLRAHLGLPEDEIKIAFVNNRHQGWNYQLAPGDRVALFPPVAGG